MEEINRSGEGIVGEGDSAKHLQEMDQEGVPKENRKLFYNYLFSGSLDFDAKFKNEK